MHDDTVRLFKNLLQNTSDSLVIDADGLNMLAENKTWLSFIPNNSILTPHPGELDRLTQKANSGHERLENARELSRKSGAIVILKGAFSAICSPSGEVHFNSTGNAGMAKGGSGDILTGLLTGLLARGIPAIHAARMGVFIHGLAGDIASQKRGFIAMHAGDILDSLSDAWLSIYNDLEN
jgi:NAD(P)H-hydrate epimerase